MPYNNSKLNIENKKTIEKKNPLESKIEIKEFPIDPFKKSIDKYFKNVSMNTANYLQSISDLQQEIMESRKKNAESIITLQKYLLDQISSKSPFPKEMLQIMSDFAEQTNNAWSFQNQLMKKSIEVLLENIHAFNKNSSEVTDLNKKIIESWASIIKESKKNQK